MTPPDVEAVVPASEPSKTDDPVVANIRAMLDMEPRPPTWGEVRYMLAHIDAMRGYAKTGEEVEGVLIEANLDDCETTPAETVRSLLRERDEAVACANTATVAADLMRARAERAEALPTRGDVGLPEATRDPVFLLRWRPKKSDPSRERWHVEGVWFTREEAEQFAKAHAYLWGSDHFGPCWHVYCVPADGEMARLLKAVTIRALPEAREGKGE